MAGEGGSLRGLRGLGLLNLHQVYEGFGQCLPPGGQVARDPSAERLLQERGYSDYFPSDLRLVGPQDADEYRNDLDSAVEGGLETGFGALVVEDPLVVSALDSIYGAAKVDFDNYLSERLDRIWEDEKSIEFKSNGGSALFGNNSAPQPAQATSSGDFAFPMMSNQSGPGAEQSARDDSAGWTGREAELAAEVEKLNNMRFRVGSLLPLAQNLAHVELPGWEAGSSRADGEGANGWEMINRENTLEQGGGGGGAGSRDAHPMQALRQVYNILDCMLCRSQEVTGGAESFRTENHFGLRGVPRKCKGAASVVAQLPEERVAELLRGSLRYLEESYWGWLRQEVLPAMQAEGHVALSGGGEVAAGSGFNSIATDVVRAWVRWFLGERPEHAEWEHAQEDRAARAPLWAQVFFLLRTGHYEAALGMVERHSFQPIIKKALRAWVMSRGMQRIGLFDTDGDGLLDERLEQELDTEYCQHVLPSTDVWMRAVYSIVNERAAPPPQMAWGAAGASSDDQPLDLRELPSIVGVQQSALRALRPSHAADTRSKGWNLVWNHVQDLLWRHLVFVRPDGKTRRFRLGPTVSESGQVVSQGVQGRLMQLLALGDDASEGLAGVDGELSREVLRRAPYVKVMSELLCLRFESALASMDQMAITCPQWGALPQTYSERPGAGEGGGGGAGEEAQAGRGAGAGGWGEVQHGVEALHMALAMDLYGVLPRANGEGCRRWGVPSVVARVDALLSLTANPAHAAQPRGVGRVGGGGSVGGGGELGAGTRGLALALHYALTLEPAEMSTSYPNAVGGRGGNDADAVELVARLMILTSPEAVQAMFESGTVYFPERNRQALLLLNGCKRAGELYLELSPRHPSLPRAKALSDRLVGASSMFLMASEYHLCFERLTDLLSKHLLPPSEPPTPAGATASSRRDGGAGPAPVATGRQTAEASAGRDEAIRHCLRMRDYIQRNGRVAPLSCGTTLVDWVEQSARNIEQVQAFFSLLVIAEAQELHEGGFHSEAFFLLLEGRPGNDALGTHMALSYPQFLSSWGSRTFLPNLAGGSLPRGDDDFRRRGGFLGDGLQADVDLEGVASRALEQIRMMDPELSGAPMSKVKRHVYGTLLLAMRCLLSWKEESRDAGAWRLVRSQAAALDALFCHISGVLHAPTSILLNFHQLHRAISQ